MQGSPAEFQIPAHWNLIGHPATCVITQQHLPPPSVHSAFTPTRNNSARLKNVVVEFLFKKHASEIAKL
jgi:hypothetical protein